MREYHWYVIQESYRKWFPMVYNRRSWPCFQQFHFIRHNRGFGYQIFHEKSISYLWKILICKLWYLTYLSNVILFWLLPTIELNKSRTETNKPNSVSFSYRTYCHPWKYSSIETTKRVGSCIFFFLWQVLCEA